MKTLAFTLMPALLLTSACGEKREAAPSGQVVATVNGKEITILDLRQEAGTANPGKPVEQAALNAIIARELLADEAKKRELDALPATAIMQDKARQLVLVDALTSTLRSSVPEPSRDEALQFVADHPSSFEQRKIFVVDQLIILASSPELIRAIAPLDTMTQIEEMLARKGVAFRRSVGTIDALSIDPDAAEKIAQLPQDAVFASPEGGVIRANRVRETVIQPVSGTEAEKVALEMIRKQRTNAMVANKIQQILADGQKSVRYNPAYQPVLKESRKTAAADVRRN